VRIPIRLKLAGALAVPLVALVAVAGYEVARADRRANEVSEETALATAAVGPGSLISTLQEERNFASVDALGMLDQLQLPVASFDEARANVDTARTQLEQFVANADPDVAAAFDEGLIEVGRDLEDLRNDVDSSELPQGLANAPWANEVFNRYTALIQTFIDGTTGIAFQVDDAELRTGVELINLATLNYETGARLVRSILLPVLTGDTSLAPRLNVAAQIAELQDQQTEMLARSVGPYEGIPEQGVLTEENDTQLAHFRSYIADGTTDVAALAEAVGTTDDTGTLHMRALAADALQREAAGALDDANTQRQMVILLAVALVGAGLGVTVLASRSITNPLRSLTGQARAMAADHLPTAVQQVLDTPPGEDVEVPTVPAIEVATRDEVANVAAVLNSVQHSALDLAVEQAALRKNIADSFVNLGRRNQNLLDRQLEFITDLERQEHDPERLEGLFRLDHLATRMRRNAESLLRLAGGTDSTQTGWGGPVPIVDVVRGALGEVEGYDRVDVRTLEPAVLGASAGADLAHALAELVENALAFSPPDERVQVRGRQTDQGGYVLAVIDQGVGMSPEQLETANRRLAGQESFTVAPSRYLGHYVAGHLATTLGVTIRLEQVPTSGITARIEVPPSLLIGTGAPVPATGDDPFDQPDTDPSGPMSPLLTD
jgi:signal transduction histidine kinase